MRTTRLRAAGPAAPAAPSDSFEEIREAFCIRLQSERIHFAALNAALACTPECPAQILDDLRNRAHRLSGTAAIFEFAAIAAAARALELTVVSAAASCADGTETQIRFALDDLVRLIADLDKHPSSARIHAPAPVQRRVRAALHG
jgi:HPt (histidine-containing phosphotransfer) domain-containing protein